MKRLIALGLLCLTACSGNCACEENESVVLKRRKLEEKCQKICPEGHVKGKFETDQYVRDRLRWYCVCTDNTYEL